MSDLDCIFIGLRTESNMKNNLTTFDSIFDYYTNKLNPMNLLYGFKGRIQFYAVIVVYTMCSAFAIYQNYLNKNSYYIDFILILFLPTILIINWNAKRYMRKKEIEPSKGWYTFWANDKYKLYKLNLLVENLKEAEILLENKHDEKRIDLLISIASKKADLYKKEFYIKGGIFLVLFLPLWNHFLGWVYRQPDIVEYSDALEILKVGMTVLSLISILLLMIKYLVDEYMNLNRAKYLNFQTDLETILLSVTKKSYES